MVEPGSPVWSHPAVRERQAPLLVADMRALERNARNLTDRAGAKPIRVATKSIRVREILHRVLDWPHFHGLLTYSLAESIWLAHQGFTDIVLAYPTVDRKSLQQWGSDSNLRQHITVMVDHPQHVQLIAEYAHENVNVCMDIDASLRIGPLHLGVRRSPIHTAKQALALTDYISQQRNIRLRGLMFYDAQIAGLPDTSTLVRGVKKLSLRELVTRRAEITAAVSQRANLEFVNGGGTGSLHHLANDTALTELAAGSGLFGPTLFDQYRGFTPEPAVLYALPVTRIPAHRVRTVFGGGYVASGPPGANRQPRPVYPAGLRTLRTEGVGEVQTPVRIPRDGTLSIGDSTWWRHAKSGEICERFTEMLLVETDTAAVPTPTYRGESQCFG